MTSNILTAIAVVLCMAHLSFAIDGNSLTIYGGASASIARIAFQTAVDQPDIPDMEHLAAAQNLYTSNAAWVIHFDPDYSTRGFPVTRESFTGYPFPRSVRRVGGDADPSQPSVTLYAGNYFNGEAFTYDGPVQSTPDAASVILLGTQPVQLFLQENWQGFSYCLRPDWTASCDCTYVNLEDIGVPSNSVKSLQFGCDGANEDILNASHRGNMSEMAA